MNSITRSQLAKAIRGFALPLLLLLPVFATAQKLKERMAAQYQEVFDYPKVAAIYEDLMKSGKADVNDMRKLSMVYRKMNQPAKAEAVLMQMMGSGHENPDDIFTYAEQLRARGKYTEAMEWYSTYAELRPDDVRVQPYIKDPGFFEHMMRDSTSALIRTLPINSPEADLGTGIMNELLLFSSARGEGIGGKREYAWDDQPFLNIYTALLKGESATDPLVMRNEVNSRYHDGTASFDSVATRLYFTRNQVFYGSLDKSSNGDLNLGIFFSEVAIGEFGQPEWGNLIPFEHNDKEFSNGHPSVTPDGRRIYFASDRPGGQGGTDIWYSDNLGNQWGAPVNMGPVVNTSGNEMYPFLRHDSTLFFASTGHPGLGGMDLFYTRVSIAGPGKVNNLGYPMNTSFNDHGLVFINDSVGFFTSDRPGGQGSDDIYGCTVRPPKMFIDGTVIDKVTRNPVEGSVIVLKDEKGEIIGDANIQYMEGGKFHIEMPYRDRLLLVTNKDGYFQNELSINAATDPLGNVLVELEKYDYAAEGIVYNGDNMQPMAGATVVLTDGKDEFIGTVTTDATGKYAFAIKPESDYILRAAKEGFFKQSARISTKGKPSGVIKTDFKLFPLEVDKVVRLDNIFYDYAKWNIRPDAAVELDKLVATLLDNPTVKIELSSHTDCRGKDAYNMSLSEKRAKSAVDYIISKGISKENVTSKGYGETKPSEDCECTKCNEEQHQKNRRTEFKVLSM